MKIILRLSLALVLCCLAAAAVLAVADYATAGARRTAALAEKRHALEAVLPEFDNDPMAAEVAFEVQAPAGAKPRTVKFLPALKEGRLVGVAGECHTLRGYGGRIDLLVGITPEGKIRAVVVTAHRETPGLGALLVERQEKPTVVEVLRHQVHRSVLPPSRYLDQYGGPALALLGQPDVFRVRQDGGQVDAVSGATVTSRAVADAVQALALAYAEHAQEIRRAAAGVEETAP